MQNIHSIIFSCLMLYNRQKNLTKFLNFLWNGFNRFKENSLCVRLDIALHIQNTLSKQKVYVFSKNTSDRQFDPWPAMVLINPADRNRACPQLVNCGRSLQIPACSLQSLAGSLQPAK